MAPPLVAVAHGSRDPRSAACISALLDVVRAQRPELDVRAAFLELSAPRVPEVLSALAAEGHREAVIVPLLLGSAYHARVDLPGLVAEARARLPRLSVSVADVLGPDERLSTLALRRLAATGVSLEDPSLGVVLAGAGSSHPRANAAVAAVAESWARRFPVAGVLPAFASAAEPSVPAAVAELRARGALRVAVASWFLAPGRLPDKVARLAGDAVVAEPLGPGSELASLVADRYAAALAPVAQYA
ncbi:sirohydrochlorin chelatase [Actinophytocola oryzae]|uniref:Sirohydrochlorin ferrochelatase n=1 Tax=Actinophytocola oryzae TaxID=502181 RepID=A0A4R7UVE7_9PSEU|nr:sirohydrochlorin chelatase [Actinophytocola oryzae]TDV38650.1 sirohydrochlorin ferrochelatase [Actinophytocola oryzae]